MSSARLWIGTLGTDARVAASVTNPPPVTAAAPVTGSTRLPFVADVEAALRVAIVGGAALFRPPVALVVQGRVAHDLEQPGLRELVAVAALKRQEGFHHRVLDDVVGAIGRRDLRREPYERGAVAAGELVERRPAALACQLRQAVIRLSAQQWSREARPSWPGMGGGHRGDRISRG